MIINKENKLTKNYNFFKTQTAKQQLSSRYAEKYYGYYNKLFFEEIREKNMLRVKKYGNR